MMTTRRVRSTSMVLAAAMLASACGGCLERKEEVRIRADGSVEIEHRLRGDPGEFRPGRADALPSGAPWTVRDRDVEKPDGSGAERVREASARFGPGEPIPVSFGAPDDPAPLRAATTVAVEPLAGGALRVVFERRYEPRAYAWRERAFRRAFPDELRKVLERHGAEAPGAPLPEELKARTLRALLDFERAKAETWLGDALPPQSAHGRLPLAAAASFREAFDRAWRPDALGSVLEASPEEQARMDARFRAEVAQFAVSAAVEALRAEALEPEPERISAAFETGRRILDATEDLQDESFEVRVSFPVPVALADAQAVLEDGGRTAVFRFKGEDLRDAPLVLRAVAEGRP